ncbi:hypothetical protein EV714DRAFT_207765 [Schizophyllum commune]
MNLGRSYSRSRSKSRSPVPPSPQPPSSPRFLPPSHYAAAAGVPYNPPSRNKDEDTRSKARPPPDTREHAATPPSDVPSESSFEFKPRTESRFSLFARRLSVSHPRPAEQDVNAADVPDIPMLEAQLLPTLRDTITRMTRPPSSASSAPPSPMLDPPRDRRRSVSPAALSSPRPQETHAPPLPPAEPREHNTSRKSSNRRNTVVAGAPPLKSPRPGDLYDSPLPAELQESRPQEPRSTRTPEPTSHRRRHHTTEAPSQSSRHAESRATTPAPRETKNVDATESARERKPSKTALKSALRSPTPKSPRPSNVAWTSTPTTPKPSKASTSRAPASSSSALQTPSRSNASGASPGFSQIPRPNQSRRGKFSDDSDVEYRYRADAVDRRKLIITNPSHSSSESEREPSSSTRESSSSTRRALASPKTNRPYQTLPARPSKLSDKTAQVLKRLSQTQHTPRPRQTYFSDADTESASEGSVSASEGSVRHAPSDSVTSTESVDEPPLQQQQRNRGSADRMRRQSALLDIVGALRESNQANGREESEYEGESIAVAYGGTAKAYNGKTGAYSGTADNASAQESSEDESEYSEYEDEPPRTPMPQNTPVMGQHRAGGTVPTFTFSDDDGGIHQHSRSTTPTRSNRAQVSSEAQLRDLDAVALAQQARAVAVRERLALGIPPSASDELPSRHARTDSDASVFSSSDSIQRSLDMQVQDSASDLSSGAEAMLRKLSTGGRAREGWRRGMQPPSVDRREMQSSVDRRASDRRGVQLPDRRDMQEYQETDSGEASAATDSNIDRPVSQFFDIPVKERVRFAEEDTMITSASEELAKRAPLPVDSVDTEVQRATLIRDFIAAEEEFVARTQVFVKHFILPLRLQNTRRWVQGVPPRSARLLDWFEDIANLHAQVLDALRTPPASQAAHSRRPSSQPVSLVPMRAFLPRLEIYQPYIVTFVAVAGEVRRDESDFGEFVGLQEEQEECAGWDLERFLAEPVNRLAAYPGSFRVRVLGVMQRRSHDTDRASETTRPHAQVAPGVSRDAGVVPRYGRAD